MVVMLRHYVKKVPWLVHNFSLLILVLAIGAGGAIAQSEIVCKPGCSHCLKAQPTNSQKSCCDQPSDKVGGSSKMLPAAAPQQSCCHGEICPDMAQASSGLSVAGLYTSGQMPPPPPLNVADVVSFHLSPRLLNCNEIPPQLPSLQQLYCVYRI